MGFFQKLFKRNANTIIYSPATGDVIPTSQVKDETFSQNMIGRGFAVMPKSGEFLSPMNGEVTLVAETGHAFSIKNKRGIEVLVHIGLDTVNINSKNAPGQPLKGFTTHVKVGDNVKVGEPIITADLALIKKLGFDPVTPVIVITNEQSTNKEVNTLVTGADIAAKTAILEVK
ncbi:MAG: PTS glucose transporter subunit IIA [Mycoplasmataceae bacterium]|jgi:PTS system glucose-specific IIA component|nr:PTS glucose transporter subunit IIA [Mycoplasmataceae bacterium]